MTLDELTAGKPKADFEVELSRAAIEEFRERGFTVIPRITTDEEVEWLGQVHDVLFAAGIHLRAGFVSDVINPVDKPRVGAQSQFIMPETRYKALTDTAFWRNGRKLAAQLMALEPDTLEGWGHMIRKPPKSGDRVHWHQDEAYWDTSFDYTALACWMPLDPATVASGCMSFLPGSQNQGIRNHRFLNDDPTGTSLFLDVEESATVPAPVEVGGASFHHCRIVHGSGPNTTDRVRRAHICEWQLPPHPRDTRAERPWVEEGNRAKMAAFMSANKR
jgi:hypothetical protein